MKETIKKIHRWLGFITGLFVFIIALTGSLYAFKDEIQSLTQTYRFVEKQDLPVLLPSRLLEIAQKILPQKELHSIKYNTDEKAVEAIFYHDTEQYYYIAYLNPYSGKVLHLQNMQEGFFPFILKGHFYLWLPPQIGQPLVASLSLLLVAILATGFFLWFPKNRSTLKQRLRFNWKETTKWKRKNFDIHALVGFYTLSIATVFIVTGLVWGFQWFAFSYYTVLGGQKSLVYQEPTSEVKKNSVAANPLDFLYQKIRAESNDYLSIEVHPAVSDSAPIAINTNTDVGTYWKMDYRYFDRYSLQEIETSSIYGKFKNSTFADKMMRMNYDLHVGAIAGFAGKFIMCCISLLIASLPVTGVLFWYGRIKK